MSNVLRGGGSLAVLLVLAAGCGDDSTTGDADVPLDGVEGEGAIDGELDVPPETEPDGADADADADPDVEEAFDLWPGEADGEEPDGTTDTACTTAAECDDSNPCTIDQCDGTCRWTHRANGSSCDDDTACTTDEACRDGACVGTAPDCSAFDGPCAVGACNPVTAECGAEPVADGTACDDGAFCTESDVCRAGACVPGLAADCSAFDDDCHTGRCDEGLDACVAEPDHDGDSCEDGLACTVGETCGSGLCGGGAAPDCSFFDGECTQGRCDEVAGGCVSEAVREGAACEDGEFCTVSERCTAGVCAGSTPRDCGDGDACTADRCDETAGACSNVLTPVPGAEGPGGAASCRDGLDNDCDRDIDLLDRDCVSCLTGADCDDLNPCSTDTCVGGGCTHGTAADGTVCDDGDPVTPRDVCRAGACTPSVCGDGYADLAGTERCDDGNTVSEGCATPGPGPGTGSCVRDCSLRQDLCGNGRIDPGEQCDDGDADSFDGCTTSCTTNDLSYGDPCTCSGSGCSISNPAGGTIAGCSGVVVPAGARLACFRSGEILGNELYFPRGFCGAFASTCTGWLCGTLGAGARVGEYATFTTCPAGTVLVAQTFSATGIALQTKSCQVVCTQDAQCRWNEYDEYWRTCGHYECMNSPSTPGTLVCFDSRSSAP